MSRPTPKFKIGDEVVLITTHNGLGGRKAKIIGMVESYYKIDITRNKNIRYDESCFISVLEYENNLKVWENVSEKTCLY